MSDQSSDTPTALASVDEIFFLKPGNRAFVEGKSRRLVRNNQIVGLVFTAVILLFLLILFAGMFVTKTFALPADDMTASGIVLIVSAIFLGVVFVVIVRQEIKFSRRYRQLALKGTLIPGKLISIKATPVSSGTRQMFVMYARQIIVEYSYTTPKGNEKTSEARWIWRNFKGKEHLLPKPGVPVAVLHVHEKLVELL